MGRADLNGGQNSSIIIILFTSSEEIGWEDIQDKTSGTFTRTILDDTLPGGPVQRRITYEAPWALCDRVQDYRLVWTFVAQESGTP